MSGNYSIQTGIKWTDYTDGRHWITLSSPLSGFLQAATPIFITIVGLFCWRVIKRIWYHIQLKSLVRSYEPKPMFKWQAQTLLRSSAGDFAMVASAFRLSKAWWGKSTTDAQRGWLPFLWIMIIGVVYWCAWIVTAVVVFYMWQDQVTDRVLITSPDCGLLKPALPGLNVTDGLRRIALSQTVLAETWVTQCYGNSSSDSAACNLYPSKSLTFQSDTTSMCPFTSDSVCIQKNSSPHRMVSQEVDSHLDLGINAPKDDRITYRKYTICSPVSTTPFAVIVNASDTPEAAIWPPEARLQRFLFGPLPQIGQDWTYEYSEWALTDGFGYQIQSLSYLPHPKGLKVSEAWTPNSTFSDRQDADISIFFLTQNSLIYNHPTDDPWFKTGGIHADGKTYEAMFDVNALSCLDQHQICSPSRNPNASASCTTPTSWNLLPDETIPLKLNPTQNATALRIIANLPTSNIFYSVSGRNAAALLASRSVSDLYQIEQLPTDQWRREVENWFQISLAKLQRGVIDFAGGPSDRELLPFVNSTLDASLQALCTSQVVKIPAGYVNFNFDALLIVYVLGGILIFIGLFFDTIFALCIGKKSHAEHQWLLDTPMQLLRNAYQGYGLQGWEDRSRTVPVYLGEAYALEEYDPV